MLCYVTLVQKGNMIKIMEYSHYRNIGHVQLELMIKLIIITDQIQMKRNKKSYQQIDSQLYSTNILEQIMQTHQWNDIQDISKLTFKALADILQTHAQSLKDLKSIITTRASKTELNTGLSLKCNLSDVAKTIQQLSAVLQQKVSFKDIKEMTRQFPSKADIVDILAQQSSRQKEQSMTERNGLMQIQILKARMDDFQKQISKRVGQCVNLTQFNEVVNILQHKANISEVNQALQAKINKQYLTTALQKKISKNQLQTILSKKADTADLDYLINSLESKVSVTTLQKLTEVLQNKADKSQLVIIANQRNIHNRSQHRLFEQEWSEKLQQVKNSLSLQIKQLKKEASLQYKEFQYEIEAFKKNDEIQDKKIISTLEIQIHKKIMNLKNQINEELQPIRLLHKNLQHQINQREKVIADYNANFNLRKKNQEKIYDEIDNVHKKLQEHITKSLDKHQFFDFKSHILETLESKAEVDQIQTAFDKFAGEINLKISENIQNIQELMRLQHDVNISNNVNTNQISQIRKILSKKSDRNDNCSFEQNLKKIRKEIEECRKTVDTAYGQIHSKISVRQYQTDLLQLHKRMEAMKKQISIKANIKDVCVLSDSKPNIQDVNNTLRQINQILADKVSQADFQNTLKNQQLSIQSLSIENIVGRWMWESGQLKPGGLIPWEAEVANTLKQTFFWQKDKTSILVLSGGIFEVTVCVFNKNSSITILANGQRINSKQTQQNLSGNVRRGKKTKQKQIRSCFLREYLMLASRSRISAICNECTEGFLNIRRI